MLLLSIEIFRTHNGYVQFFSATMYNHLCLSVSRKQSKERRNTEEINNKTHLFTSPFHHRLSSSHTTNSMYLLSYIHFALVLFPYLPLLPILWATTTLCFRVVRPSVRNCLTNKMATLKRACSGKSVYLFKHRRQRTEASYMRVTSVQWKYAWQTITQNKTIR